MTPAQHELIAKYDRRAVTLGISKATADWPYGPDRDVPMRGRLLDWAEPLGVRLSQRGMRCPCALAGRHTCGVYQHGRQWLDHVTLWNKGGKRVMLVAQPYVISLEDQVVLAALGDHPDLHVSISKNGWYGHGATMIEMWRRAAIPRIPAPGLT